MITQVFNGGTRLWSPERERTTVNDGDRNASLAAAERIIMEIFLYLSFLFYTPPPDHLFLSQKNDGVRRSVRPSVRRIALDPFWIYVDAMEGMRNAVLPNPL